LPHHCHPSQKFPLTTSLKVFPGQLRKVHQPADQFASTSLQISQKNSVRSSLTGGGSDASRLCEAAVCKPELPNERRLIASLSPQMVAESPMPSDEVCWMIEAGLEIHEGTTRPQMPYWQQHLPGKGWPTRDGSLRNRRRRRNSRRNWLLRMAARIGP
jgi:hypothetical protein